MTERNDIDAQELALLVLGGWLRDTSDERTVVELMVQAIEAYRGGRHV